MGSTRSSNRPRSVTLAAYVATVSARAHHVARVGWRSESMDSANVVIAGRKYTPAMKTGRNMMALPTT